MKNCILCFQNINKHQDIFHWLKQDSMLCGTCLQQFELIDKHIHFEGIKVHVLYGYNEFLENMLFQYKEGRDIALAPVFLHEQKAYIQKLYQGYTLCLCPSSEEKTKERGFHALSFMLKELHLPMISPIIKSENRKQSQLHYAQRQNIHEILQLQKDIKIPAHKLLLIDDVCTTGATLKACYNLLKPYAKDIQILAICANPLFIKES